ncbi:MAG: hypothetical protein ACLPUO_04875 [Streptosporangiaceae bacterium]
MADDDWRVTVTFRDERHVGRGVQSLLEQKAEDDPLLRLHHRVAVATDGASLYLYTGTEQAAREADRVARQVMTQRGLAADYAVDRWHPVAEEWEDATAAMPQTAGQQQEEHQRLEAEETAESLSSGRALWEVRVELPSHRDAVELAERLRTEGRPVIRRWKFLVVGANDEDQAKELAGVLAQEAPGATSVHPEHAGVIVPYLLF